MQERFTSPLVMAADTKLTVIVTIVACIIFVFVASLFLFWLVERRKQLRNALGSGSGIEGTTAVVDSRERGERISQDPFLYGDVTLAQSRGEELSEGVEVGRPRVVHREAKDNRKPPQDKVAQLRNLPVGEGELFLSLALQGMLIVQMVLQARISPQLQ